MGKQTKPPFSPEYEKEVKELEKTISALKATCAAKEQEVTSLKKQIESQRKNDLRGGSELDEQLKKAKKTAFVARGNVTKKNLEISHLKNEIQSSQENAATLERIIYSLQSEFGNLRDDIHSLMDVLVSQVEELSRQISVNNAELANLREREKMWIESNASLKAEIAGMREQFDSFKKEMFEEIKNMNRQQLANNPQPPSFHEKETGSQWTHSIIREEATESDLRLQKAREKIPKVEERFSHQGEQWRNLLNATNTELTAPKVTPLTSKPATERGPPPQIPSSSDQAGLHKVNPYSLKAAKAKRGVLNSRPLPSTIDVIQAPVGVAPLIPTPPQAPLKDTGSRPPMIFNPYAQNSPSEKRGVLNSRPLPSTIGVIQAPVGVGPLMPTPPQAPLKDTGSRPPMIFNPYAQNSPSEKCGVLNSRPLPPTIGVIQPPVGVAPLMPTPPQAPLKDMGSRPPMIFNPYAQNSPSASSPRSHLNGRPLPRTDPHVINRSFAQHPGMYPPKVEEEGFFTRALNKFLGF